MEKLYHRSGLPHNLSGKSLDPKNITGGKSRLCLLFIAIDDDVADQKPLNMLSMTPAATAEPMTPATLGPMACMSRKLLGL